MRFSADETSWVSFLGCDFSKSVGMGSSVNLLLHTRTHTHHTKYKNRDRIITIHTPIQKKKRGGGKIGTE